METLDKEGKKIDAAIEPLTKEEETYLGLLIERIKIGDSQEKNEYEWQIVEEFGERAVPYLINKVKQEKLTWLSKINIRKFLDTLVTEKTAPLVLRGMQEGEIDFWCGALAAAEGKDKTASGLADLLFKIEWPNSSGRGYQISLLEAMGLCGADETSPKIVEFYKKLRSDQNYAKNLKSFGSDLYGEDAHDVVRALYRINGPISKKHLEDLAQNGDKYIKPVAQKALDGKLYIGKPTKFLIGNPEKIEMDKESQDYYSNWNNDVDEPESASREDYVNDPGYWRKPETLTQSYEINFLNQAQAMEGGGEKSIEEYLDGKKEILETLGALIGRPEFKSLADFPKDKIDDALKVAAYFEACRAITKLPNLENTKNAVLTASERIDSWAREADANSRAALDYINSLDDALGEYTQEDFRLPESANSFILQHQKLRKERNISAFADHFYKKTKYMFIENMREAVSSTGDFTSARDLFFRIKHAIELYKEVADQDIPVYEIAQEKLKNAAKNRKMVFYGRDADYFYSAVKAARFGLYDNKKLSKVYVSRTLSRVLKNPDSEMRQRIMAYLLQEKVGADAIHIDSGFSGSVPEAVIKSLNPSLTESEINSRIKLLESRHSGREQIGVYGGEVDAIENRPHNYGDIIDIERSPVNGRLRPRYHKEDSWKQLEAWVASQAVIRHFAPKGVEKKEIDRKDEIRVFIEGNATGPKRETAEVIRLTKELYDKAKEIVAPVIVAFADHVLSQALERGKNEKLIFVARDGIGPYNAAVSLLKKFPERYVGFDEQQLVYAHLTRKVVQNSSQKELAEYLDELGISAGDNATLVDVGMYGTIIRPLESKLDKISFNKTEYLVSKTGEANGFIDNDQDKRLPVFENIVGNPAVHFMEDTFSGPIQSPTNLQKTNGDWQPDTKDAGYPPEIAAKRKFALLAIEDYVAEMEKPEIDLKKATKKLNTFLSNAPNFKNLMVPHEK